MAAVTSARLINSNFKFKFITPDGRQSKTILTIDEHGSKIDGNSVFDCHLSPVGRQMAIENSVSGYC